MSHSTSHQPTVLIADDNTWMQRVLAKILIGFGLKPIFASNAYEAVALSIEMQPQAIVLDIVMPEINGMQTLRFLKTINTTRHIPVLIITAAADPETVGQALHLGAEGFIRKPFTRSSIHEKLTAALGLKLQAEAENTQRISDAELDEIMHVERKDDSLSSPLRGNARRSSLSVTPVVDENTSNAATNSQPGFNVLHRRSRHSARKAGVELPDEETVREILKNTTRR